MATPQDFQVLRDTREQAGWDFPKGGCCLGTEAATLKTGDYTLAGYEGVFALERKGTVAEFATNAFEKRFERELERLDQFKYAFVILEFEIEDIVCFPANSGIPRSRWDSLRVTPKLLMKRLNDFQVKHRAKFVPVGSRGREYAFSLFKRIVEMEKPCPPRE